MVMGNVIHCYLLDTHKTDISTLIINACKGNSIYVWYSKMIINVNSITSKLIMKVYV